MSGPPSKRAQLMGTGPAGWALGVVGVVGAALAAGLDGTGARAAAAQDWPPFVLVAGLLLVGLVADDDGLFEVAGRTLARASANGVVLFAGATVLVALVTSILNLDTSVAFLTPVLVHAARSRDEGERPLLYGCLLLSNAASLLLPGSNLTNLIVLGHLHLSGGGFLRRAAPAWVASVVVTALVVGVAEHRSLRARARPVAERGAVPIGAGIVAVVAVTVLVLVLGSPAPAVAGVGVAAVAVRMAAGRQRPARVLGVLGVPILAGLFGVAVALGTLGRAWSGPTVLLAHLDAWGTAAVAAVASVLVNNLPAASLLAARVPHRPLALLVGLDIGPNLFVTGSLSWILWRRAAEAAGARPSIARASLLGLVSVPLAMAAAIGALALTGSR
ncbi:MAG TPA: SLC13 family permease [Acidimicrobiales bacterium]|nr:SLC13 family permease [Acidimicrobiales bacterium]